MKNEISSPGKKRRHILASRILFVTLALSFMLLISSCQRGIDPRLPEEYCGTSWICTDPYATFDVDDSGHCTGTIVLNGISFPSTKFNFVQGRYCSIGMLYEEEDTRLRPEVFHGDYTLMDDVIILKGTWSRLLEEYYNIVPEKGECTLIFERIGSETQWILGQKNTIGSTENSFTR